MIENNTDVTIDVANAIHTNMGAAILATIKLIKKASIHSGANISWLPKFEKELRKLSKAELTARIMDAVKWSTDELKKEPAVKYVKLNSVRDLAKQYKLSTAYDSEYAQAISLQARTFMSMKGIEIKGEGTSANPFLYEKEALRAAVRAVAGYLVN